MTPTEELDLARAKDMAFDKARRSYPAGAMEGYTVETWWLELKAVGREEWVKDAKFLRLGDEARDLRVVPVPPNRIMQDFGNNALAQMARDAGIAEEAIDELHCYAMWTAMLAASPYAPEPKLLDVSA
jgi:hypothetical protein